jgi:hypothetical protein
MFDLERVVGYRGNELTPPDDEEEELPWYHEDELEKWTREELIQWLKNNDPNGVYLDEESLDEIGCVLEKEEAIELIIKQVEG